MGSSSSARHDPALTRHLPDVFGSLDDLFAAGAAAKDLMRQPGWEALTQLLEAEVAEIDARLDGRLLETKAEYAHLHGRRGGLRAARAFLEALIDRAESRLAEQRAKHEEPVGAGSDRG